MSVRKTTERDLKFQKKILEEYDVNYEHAYSIKRNRGFKTFEELYEWYTENSGLVKRAQDILSPLTDDEVSILLDTPTYKLEKCVYSLVYSDTAYRRVRNREMCEFVISRHLANIKANESVDIKLSYIKDILWWTKNLSLESSTKLLGFKSPAITKSFFNLLDTLYENCLSLEPTLDKIYKRLYLVSSRPTLIAKLTINNILYTIKLVKELNLIIIYKEVDIASVELQYVIKTKQINHHIAKKNAINLIRKKCRDDNR